MPEHFPPSLFAGVMHGAFFQPFFPLEWCEYDYFSLPSPPKRRQRPVAGLLFFSFSFPPLKSTKILTLFTPCIVQRNVFSPALAAH